MNKYYIPTRQELIEAFINEETIYSIIWDTEEIIEIRFSDRSINSLYGFINISDKTTYSDGISVVDINPELYKLKVLDQSDIESFGFKLTQESANYNRLFFENEHWSITMQPEFDGEFPDIIIRKRDWVHYSGIIKNKSELFKLLDNFEYIKWNREDE